MVDYGELHQGLRSEKMGRALSIGSNVVNDSHFRVLSSWWRVYGNKIKRNRKKTNPYGSQLGTLSVA